MKRYCALFLRWCHCIRGMFSFEYDGHCAVDQELIDYAPLDGTVRVRKHSCTCGKVFYKDDDFDDVYAK